MTENELKDIEKGYTESKLQHTCVGWFRHTFPSISKLMFAVPNGGWRGSRAGAQMVYEGQVKGAADIILLYPSKGKSSLCIEMKVPHKRGRTKSMQSEHQKEWQALVEKYGSCYVVCRGLMDFIECVGTYLSQDTEKLIANALNKYPMYV